MAKKIKVLCAILCEHVVAGAQNKPTLINLYAGDIILAEMPVPFGFGLYIEMASRDAPFELLIEIKLDGQVFFAFNAAFPPHHPQATVQNVILPFAQSLIDRDLTFTVDATADGYARTTIIKKRIYKGTVPGFTSPSA